MAIEIERKYLVKDDSWRNYIISSTEIIQGYLCSNSRCEVRVRVRKGKNIQAAWMTAKSTGACVERVEVERDICIEDAKRLLALSDSVVSKVRHLVLMGDLVFEVDEYTGDNKGLTIAELEVCSADFAFEKPLWLGEEVTTDIKYRNSQLAKNPYSKW